MLRRAVELGVNFIDTADSYGPDVSEELIARGAPPVPGRSRHRHQGRPGAARPGRVDRQRPARSTCARPARAACAGCRLEQIPLYQFHRPDPTVPLEDSIGALVELKEQGKIRHIGVVQRHRGAAAARAAAHPDRVDPEPLQRRRPRLGVAGRPVRAGADGVPAVGADPEPRRQRGGARRSRARYGVDHRGRSCWPGCSARSPAILPIPGTGSVSHLEDEHGGGGGRADARRGRDHHRGDGLTLAGLMSTGGPERRSSTTR